NEKEIQMLLKMCNNARIFTQITDVKVE
ncbi:MAG: hypothetical protein ACI9CD_000714, partial [Candidatus Deianiraeaceae bacterium]